ncbi:hypothetical protein OEZ85_006117 [Tetradesmus obliquus]|uniref:Aquaporin n=1 Tax=Tetradesmus obliquus TaxID=3088 RepID=A0ABY8UGW3_TETOB|nr:hypothetical protein OEZ85_006117 [Tetradesmus obliquus]
MLREDIVGASSASAEFLGTLLLQLFAGSTLVPLRIAAVFAALMATFARHSGGHLNPGISLAAALSGHLAWAPAAMYMLAQAVSLLLRMAWAPAAMYMLAQVLGALAGAALQVLLTPGLSFGATYEPSCHAPAQGLGGTPLFFWEALAAFVFVYAAYPALFVRPSYGSFGPLYVGLALFAVLSTGGAFTGMSPLNPAMSFAGTLVYDCEWRYVWMYVLGQYTGAGLAALLAVGVYGIGPMYLSEAERANYVALHGGPETGLSGGAGGMLSGQQQGGVAAPAGSQGMGVGMGTAGQQQGGVAAPAGSQGVAMSSAGVAGTF